MDQECSLVEHLHLPVIENVTLVIHAEKIALVDTVEIDAERIDPEGIWFDRISHGYVSSNTFVEAMMSKDAICASEAAFNVVSLLVLVVELELWW